MSCQRKYIGGRDSCPKYQKKNDYRIAKRKFPNIDNSLENWECSETEEANCTNHKPYPPRMTEQEFSEKQTELLNELPEEFKSVISGMAWERGHSAGYEEVVLYLQDYVNELKDPIKKFEERIRTKS